VASAAADESPDDELSPEGPQPTNAKAAQARVKILMDDWINVFFITAHRIPRITRAVLTFIFTRCAAMEFCPRMNSKFNELQAAIQKEDLKERVRLLSITLDPEFDRPEHLKEFGEAIKADPAIWNFATGSKAQIDALTKDFRVFRENKEGVLNHTLCTALIRPDGTLEKIWRGNYWKPEDVLEKIK